MDIGFVGLGAMGRPMAALLGQNGHSVHGFDASPAVRERMTGLQGVTLTETLAAAAAKAEVLFTCLPNNAVVREAYLGRQGLAGALQPGSISVDCSTVGPSVTEEIAAALKPRRVHHLDASMLGSVPQAETGEIGFVVGGDPGAYECIGPLLDILGRFRVHAGPPGAANRIKLIHQTLVAINAAAVAEAVGLCLATGTDLDCFYGVVKDGGGMAQSRYFERRVPRMRAGDFSPLFMLDFMAKDAGLARDLARDAGFPTPILDRTLEIFCACQAEGWGAEDFSAVAHHYEALLGRGFADADS
jgi:3-hydroxyisobutyrate dehydrogenase-like beta-hydroxyacid dehydrogenase